MTPAAKRRIKIKVVMDRIKNGGGAGGQQQAAPPDRPKEPQSIEKGQTEDQVIAAFGKPDKIVNLGAKKALHL